MTTERIDAEDDCESSGLTGLLADDELAAFEFVPDRLGLIARTPEL